MLGFLAIALRGRGRESVIRGNLDGEDTRWRKARRRDDATLLRLLEPRSKTRERVSDSGRLGR